MSDEPWRRSAPPPAPPPGISPTVPDPGAPRLVAGPDGEPVGLEVWTGTDWLQVRDVTVMLSSHRAREPVWQTATAIFGRIAPAPMPPPDQAEVRCGCSWRGIVAELKRRHDTGEIVCPHCGFGDRLRAGPAEARR